MSIILTPDSENQPEQEGQVTELKYKATERDEEMFFLMYHMNMPPSEVERLTDDYRKWLIARFMAQKGMEREMMERHNLMRQIAPTLKT